MVEVLLRGVVEGGVEDVQKGAMPSNPSPSWNVTF